MTFRLLFFALLATAMGQSVVMTTLPPLGREVGLTEFQVAFLMSSSALMYAAGNALWSRVGKRKGYRRVLITGLTGYTIAEEGIVDPNTNTTFPSVQAAAKHHGFGALL